MFTSVHFLTGVVLYRFEKVVYFGGILIDLPENNITIGLSFTCTCKS